MEPSALKIVKVFVSSTPRTALFKTSCNVVPVVPIVILFVAEIVPYCPFSVPATVKVKVELSAKVTFVAETEFVPMSKLAPSATLIAERLEVVPVIALLQT